MSIPAFSSTPTVRAAMLAVDHSASPSAAQLAADRKALQEASLGKPTSAPAAATPEQIKKAASQFEAIILRQLLEPSLGNLMSGGIDGGAGSSGGGMYGYMLTDSVSNSIAQGGGLGWARLLEKQLSPPEPKADK